MFDKEKLVYYLQGGLMVSIFISPYLFHQYRLPLIGFHIYEIIALIFGVIGIFLSIKTIRVMGNSFETKPRPKKEAKLVTQFPFTISRNPMYVAGFLLTLSWSFAHYSLITLVFSLIFQFVIVLKVLIEEELLEEKFGEDYVSYKEKTPRWLLL